MRKFKTNKLYSFLNISGFAIGFAVVLIIILFINNETTVDHDFKDYNRIYRLVLSDENDCFIRYEAAQELLEKYSGVENATPVQYLTGYSCTVGSEGSFASLKDIVSTDNRFFSVFGLKLIEGFSTVPFSEKNAAVISLRLAQLLFGKTSPLGKTIDICGFLKVRITGVVEDFPSNTSFFSDIYVNIEDEKLRIIQSGEGGKMWNPAYIFIKLDRTGNKKLFERRLSSSENALESQVGSMRLQPLEKIYFERGIKNNSNRMVNTSMLYLFAAITALILLLSIANHINFSISMQFSRLRETGIKKTFGAEIRQLTVFYLMENAFSIILSFIIAVGIVFEALPLADHLFERNLDIVNLTRVPINLFILSIILIMILLTSIVPLYLIMKFDIYRFMSRLLNKPFGRNVNNILSVFQITVSIILIVSLVTIYRQLSFVKHADFGFNKENLIRIKLPGNFLKGDLVKQELGKFPFVKASTLSLGIPGMINSRAGSGESGNEFMLNCIEVDKDFVETFCLKILSGRNFRNGDIDSVCIINEAAYKKYGWTDIEDKKFRNYGGPKIVGVVNDFCVSSMHDEIEPVVLILYNRFRNTLSLRLEPGNIFQQIAQIKDAWGKIMPDYMFDFVFYDEFFNSLYIKEERQGAVISIFSLIAILITLMGMTGMIFQTCLARTKEIGIRKINGANVLEILFLLNRDLIMRIIIAFAIAVPVSYYSMYKWLQNFAYKTELRWWIFILSGIIVLVASITTITLQSWKTASRNPAESLRYE